VKSRPQKKMISAVKESIKLSHLLSEGSNLSAYEMQKYGKNRWQIFLEKMRSTPPGIFKLISGEEVIIPLGEKGSANGDLEAALNKIVNATSSNSVETAEAIRDYKNSFKSGVISFDVKNEKEILIKSPSSLAKTTDFGGRGPGSGLLSEQKQVDQINVAIAESSGDTGSVDIRFGNGQIITNIVSCKHVKANKKADAAFIDKDGNAVAWVSLKYADTPKEMNQWTGVSKLSKEIEVISFAKDVKKFGEIEQGKVVFRELSEVSLSEKAVWGLEKEKGENLVDLVISTRSEIKLSKNSDGTYSFTITSGKIWYHPEIPDDGWDPVLTARSSKDRNDLGVPKTRIGFFPKDYRKDDKKVELLSTTNNVSLGETRFFLKELFKNS
jgi:hypothetical protein